MMRARSLKAATAGTVVALAVLAGSAFGGSGTTVTKSGSITVHGRWTLVVRNRSGKVVARRRFENALTPTGAQDLVNILGRSKVVGRWGVGLLAEPVGYGDCTGSAIDCWMSVESDWGDISFAHRGTFKTLTVKPQVGSVSEVTLAGNVTIDADTTITRVDSYLLLCSATTTPVVCGTSALPGPDEFTTKGLSPGLALSGGQQVSITVNFSFS